MADARQLVGGGAATGICTKTAKGINGTTDLLNLRRQLSDLTPQHEGVLLQLNGNSELKKRFLLQTFSAERTKDGTTVHDSIMEKTGRRGALETLVKGINPDIFKQNCVVLDVNANDGAILELIIKVVGYEILDTVFANNISSKMRDALEERLTSAFGQWFRERLRFLKRTITMPFKMSMDGKETHIEADVVIAALNIHKLKNGDKSKYLEAAAKAVKKGGYLLLIEEWPQMPLPLGTADTGVVILYNSTFYPTMAIDQIRSYVSSLGFMVEEGSSASLPEGNKMYLSIFRREG